MRPIAMTSKEYCFGCKLSSEEVEYSWEPGVSLDGDDVDDAEKGFVYSLILKHAVLGADTKVGEVNVVELHTNNFFSEEIRQPILHLINGRTEQCQLDILLTEPFSKLCLVKGSGPVYIWGQLIVELDDDAFEPVGRNLSDVEEVNESEETDDEEVDDEEVEDIAKDAAESRKEEVTAKIKKDGVATKKRKTSGSKEPVKKTKLSPSGDSIKKETEEEDEDSEEEDSDEDVGKENTKTPKAQSRSAPASAKKATVKKRQSKQKGR